MKKIAMLLVALLMSGTMLHAQEKKVRSYELYPYTFIGVQGGGQVTFTDFDASKLITPIGAISVGHYFAPSVGARINVSGWKGKSGLKQFDRTFDYNYVTTNLDLLLNLSNIICPNENGHVFNAILVGGVGLAYAWDQERLTDLRALQAIESPSMAWEDDRLVRNFRVGMQFDFNVSKHLGLNLEVTANNYADRFNSKRNTHGDWQLNALVGLSYKFGYRARKTVDMSSVMATDVNANAGAVAVATAPVEKPVEKKEVKPVPAPAPKPQPAPAPKLEKKEANIFFTINSSEISPSEEAKVADIAEWLKNHPKAKMAMVCGYADAGTGNASINKRIARERVEAVAAMLTNKYGVEAARLSIDSKGDTVQPFQNNDSNRVVIVLAEEK